MHADDIVCHCRSEEETKSVLNGPQEHLTAYKRHMRPVEIRPVYFKEGRWRENYFIARFVFLVLNSMREQFKTDMEISLLALIRAAVVRR